MSGLTDGYGHYLDSDHFEAAENEFDLDSPDIDSDSDPDSNEPPDGHFDDEELDFLHPLANILSLDDDDDHDESSDGLDPPDSDPFFDSDADDDSFLTDGLVTISYVNNKLAFRKGDLQGEIFAYTELDPSIRSSLEQTRLQWSSSNSRMPPPMLAIDGSQLYANNHNRHPVEIQINHGNFMFIDLMASTPNEAVLVEVNQIYDDNGDVVSHTLKVQDNKPLVTLFMNPELVTPPRSTSVQHPTSQTSHGVETRTGISLGHSSRPPVIRLPASQSVISGAPTPLIHTNPSPGIHQGSQMGNIALHPLPPRPMSVSGGASEAHGRLGAPAPRNVSSRSDDANVGRPEPLGSTLFRGTGRVSSPRGAGAPKIRLKISKPGTIPHLHKGSYSNAQSGMSREVGAPALRGDNPPLHDVYVDRPLGRGSPGTPSSTIPSNPSNTYISNTGGWDPPTSTNQLPISNRLPDLPGVRPVNSYTDLLSIDQDENPNMYASRVYLAEVINQAPLYLLGVERLLTPEAIIMISRMLNNRLWLKTKYSEIHEDILDLMVDICPELNGLSD
jgi:hypothetical protein